MITMITAYIVLIIITAIIMWGNSRNINKRLNELQELHQESQDLYGRICYMTGFRDAMKNKQMDYETAKKTINEEIENY